MTNTNNVSGEEKEAIRFLEHDFNQCFQQMRFDDSKILEKFKFLFYTYTAIIGASLTLYKFGLKYSIDLSLPSILILGVGMLLGLILFGTIVRNRVYFVQVTRYINEIRQLFLQYKPLGFQNQSCMYTDPNKPPFFDPRSAQAWLIYVVALINSFLPGVLAYISIGQMFNWIILIPITIFAIQIIGAIKYLKSRENKPADKAVFGEKNK